MLTFKFCENILFIRKMQEIKFDCACRLKYYNHYIQKMYYISKNYGIAITTFKDY